MGARKTRRKRKAARKRLKKLVKGLARVIESSEIASDTLMRLVKATSDLSEGFKKMVGADCICNRDHAGRVYYFAYECPVHGPKLQRS